MTQLEHRDTELAEEPLLDTKLDNSWVFSEAASMSQPVSCPHVSQSTSNMDSLGELVTQSTSEKPDMSGSGSGLAGLESLFSLTVLSDDDTYVLSSDKPFVVCLGKSSKKLQPANKTKTIKDEE